MKRGGNKPNRFTMSFRKAGSQEVYAPESSPAASPGQQAHATASAPGSNAVSARPAKKSRFAPANASATSPTASATVTRPQGSYLAGARERSAKMKGYFDDDSDENEGLGPHPTERKGAKEEAEEEVDPLDAFMAGVQHTVKVESENIGKTAPKPDFLDEEAEQGDGRLKEEGEPQSGEDTDEEQEDTGAVDSEGYPIGRVPEEKKRIEPLPPIDHSLIEYESFRKDFYEIHPDMQGLNAWEVKQLRNEIQVSVEAGKKRNDENVPAPVRSFKHANFDDVLLTEIIRQGFEAPTPIQAQALPVVMSGRDMIGVAQTGSGKTLAFIWPALVHVMDQRVIVKGKEGPIVVVLAPTRELAGQIYSEANKFAKRYGCKVCAVFGGAGKWEMQKALKEGPEIVVATPGRMIEMIKMKATNMGRCTMMILDEADRMFDMGFEYQMRSIVGQIRPDRQTLMFSATFKHRVQQLAADILTDPVHVHVGSHNLTANEDIHQVVRVLAGDALKWKWFTENVPKFVEKGKVLVFVSSKQGCEDLCKSLNAHTSLQAGAIHGDKDQQDREQTLRAFKHGAMPILVGTDVASRGLDIKNVNTVVNYDVAKNIETHIHRVGRTGRMGKDGVHPGTAYTLVTPKQATFAADLVYHLESAKQEIPKELEALARTSGRRRGGGGGGGFGGGGERGAASAGQGKPGAGIGFVASGAGKSKGAGAGSNGSGGGISNAGSGGGRRTSSGNHAPALTSAQAAAASASLAINLPPALMASVTGVGKGRVHNSIEDAYDTKAPWSPGSSPTTPPGTSISSGSTNPMGRRKLWSRAPPVSNSPQQQPLPPPPPPSTLKAPPSPVSNPPHQPASGNPASSETAGCNLEAGASSGASSQPRTRKSRWN